MEMGEISGTGMHRSHWDGRLWSRHVTTCHQETNDFNMLYSLLHGPVEAVHQFRSFESWSHRLWTQHILMTSQNFTTPYIRLCMALQDV